MVCLKYRIKIQTSVTVIAPTISIMYATGWYRENHESVFCKACDLNRTIPDLGNPEYVQEWKTIETAKHRWVYSLLRMKLPLVSKTINEETGLAFDFVADTNLPKAEKILTGHDNGLITINIAEADDIKREMARKSMQEVYRTVLGHFRHEIAHYYWDRLIADTNKTPAFRSLFGDENLDYEEALKTIMSRGRRLTGKKTLSVHMQVHIPGGLG